MKKIITLLLTTVMCFSVTACGGNQKSSSAVSESADSTSTVSESVIPESDQAAESSEQVESPEQATSADTEEQGIAEPESETRILVAYFSNTGNTRAIAESIAAGVNADIYEIVAEVPYTEADLDYGDNNSRSTLEMNDPSVRPAISGIVENMDQYEKIYIGYPIWWGEAPRIVDTFVESYDFTGKIVIPFCTSASSGMGSSARGIEELAGSGNWQEGVRFSGSESAETVMEWAGQF